MPVARRMTTVQVVAERKSRKASEFVRMKLSARRWAE